MEEGREETDRSTERGKLDALFFRNHIAPGFSIVGCIPEVNSLHIVRALKRGIFRTRLPKVHCLFLGFPPGLFVLRRFAKATRQRAYLEECNARY